MAAVQQEKHKTKSAIAALGIFLFFMAALGIIPRLARGDEPFTRYGFLCWDGQCAPPTPFTPSHASLDECMLDAKLTIAALPDALKGDKNMPKTIYRGAVVCAQGDTVLGHVEMTVDLRESH